MLKTDGLDFKSYVSTVVRFKIKSREINSFKRIL